MQRPLDISNLVRVAAAATSLFALGACASAPHRGLGPLIPDRPDFTDGTEVVGHGLLQVESGSTYSHGVGERAGSLGEVLVRAGYGRRNELRLGLNSYTLASYGDGIVRGIEDMSIGTKVKLVDGGGVGSWRPAVAVEGVTTVPTGSTPWRADKLQPLVKLATAWDLTDRVAFSSNLNYSWVRERLETWGEPAASASLGIGLSDRVGSYVEYFGFFPQYYGAENSHYVNSGLTYGVSDNLQLDVRLGHGVARAVSGPNYFFGVGVARRW